MAGCSSPHSATSPSVTFGSAATTPGMPGMSGMPSMPNMPAGTSAATTGPAGSGRRRRGQHRQLRVRPRDADRRTRVAPSPGPTDDEEPHTVVANDGSFHSPGMGTRRHLLAHLPDGRHVRLRLLDSPDDARHRGGDAMTDDPHTMNRRQLIRHSGMVRRGGRLGGGRRRGHLPRRRHCRCRARSGSAHSAIRPSQRQPHRTSPERPIRMSPAPSATRSIGSTTSVTHRISLSTPATSPIWPPPTSSTRSSR